MNDTYTENLYREKNVIDGKILILSHTQKANLYQLKQKENTNYKKYVRIVQRLIKQ